MCSSLNLIKLNLNVLTWYKTLAYLVEHSAEIPAGLKERVFFFYKFDEKRQQEFN